eukprot:567273-Prorocentrum_minimum.AAC.1
MSPTHTRRCGIGGGGRRSRSADGGLGGLPPAVPPSAPPGAWSGPVDGDGVPWLPHGPHIRVRGAGP